MKPADYRQGKGEPNMTNHKTAPWQRNGAAFTRYLQQLGLTGVGQELLRIPQDPEELGEIEAFLSSPEVAPYNISFETYMVLKSHLTLMDQNEELRKYLARIEDHLGAIRTMTRQQRDGLVPQDHGDQGYVQGPQNYSVAEMAGPPSTPQGPSMARGQVPPHQGGGPVEVLGVNPNNPEDQELMQLAAELGDPAHAFDDLGPGGARGGNGAGSPTQLPPEVQQAIQQHQGTDQGVDQGVDQGGEVVSGGELVDGGQADGGQDAADNA